MFTKALITETPKLGDNHYKVRIPLFEDTTGQEVIMDALCCHAPGVFNGFNVGDCVYVTFEDAKLNIPVIIGKLYVNEQDDFSTGYFNNIKVTNNVKLPMDTTFGNGLKIKSLYDTIQYLNSNSNLNADDGSEGSSGISGIVESGTSGSWYYRKWADGTAECWASRVVTDGNWGAWGSTGLLRANFTVPDYPKSLFIESPVVTLGLEKQTSASANNIKFIAVRGYGTITNMGGVSILGAVAASTDTDKINLHAIGRWK